MTENPRAGSGGTPAADPAHPAPAQRGDGFKLRGAGGRRPAPPSLSTTSLIAVTPKAELAPAATRSDLLSETTDVADDDLIELEFQDGERLWLRADEYRVRFAAATRAATGDAILDVPTSLPLLPAGMQARGPVKWAIKSLKVFGVDLAGMAAETVAGHVEAKTSEKRPSLGLLRCTLRTEAFALAAPPAFTDAAGPEPWLILIHGTGSSTWSSFGDLWSRAREPQLAALRDAYGERVLAFEHATLTQSPLRNALDLARALPPNARLHLVTHSRGGLVGELLCRAAAVALPADGQPAAPFHSDEFTLFERRKEDRENLELLKQLDTELRARRFVVERFVRVACPALGTTLASGRLDRWLSVIGSVAGGALPGTPLADAFKDLGDFVAAVVKERTQPDRLPGLEAMMPDSPFIKLVNWPGAKVSGDLAVIAGDIDPRALWARLIVWLSDRFYDGDHDLIVNTPSMRGGTARAGAAVVSVHKGAGVNHFTYFGERASAERVVHALTATAISPSEFEPLARPVKPIARAVPKRAAPAATVFVLPGIMGSELAVGGDSVWIKLLALVRGGLGRLALGPDTSAVTPTAPVGRYYNDIIERLTLTHHVVPFPYDWRLPVAVEADRLAASVRRELAEAARRGMPVRLLAHSMGGLVARTMIARHDALWRELCAREGGRLIMLGTPNGGSHAITELLVGASSTLRKLARLDIKHDRKELLHIISRFPGVLAMLPVDAREDYFSENIWRSYSSRAGDGWVPPSAQDLAGAREFRRVLDTAPLDPDHVVYVAGSADVTVAAMHIVRAVARGRERIEFLATTRGDGRVTWDSGIPPGVPTFYMDVEHGDLAAHEPSFDAIEELLVRGTTTRLPDTAPVSRAAAAALFPLPPAEDDLFPAEEDLEATVLGAGSRKHRQAARTEKPVRVNVVHGNLAFARWPVAVGHYAGDTIISAERYLDRTLENALTRRNQLGIYPGALETNAIVINPKLAKDPSASPRGAIVVGLGTVGMISAATLARSFSRALLDYVLEWGKVAPRSAGENDQELGVSALLIGTGAAGIPVSDAVFALLRGVHRANELLAEKAMPERIGAIEFIDLWEDRAIQAFKALRVLAAEPVIRAAFAIDDVFESRDGGMRRLTYEEPAGWWHRLQILGGGFGGEPSTGTLRFSTTTGRARSEVRLLSTQRALVDQFIQKAIDTTRDNRDVARTLFELLLPNDLKESAPDQDNLVLLLDEDAARYPWELLEDGRAGNDRPWSVEHGLLRQLESLEFNTSIRGVLENTALVIGDPISSFAELKGAQAEAEAVWRTLQRGFNATKHIRPTSDRFTTALFARPYRVLHLAGHGVYKHVPADATSAPGPKPVTPVTPVTGMVIGDGKFFSPREVQQMRPVPELVFINCCFLGRIEDDGSARAPEPPASVPFHRLAANVATEFIRAGVRAVIAAGWAVDDDAASTFATSFYDAMLDGQTFGKAVHAARRATFMDHPGSNTWGAYQCYGDPDYRLILTGEPVQKAQDALIVSPEHAVQELSNIASRLKTSAGDEQKHEEELLARIAGLVAKRNWLDRGVVAAALARAYSDARRFDEAIDYYRLAVAAGDGAASIRDIEQLANLEVRRAAQQWGDNRRLARASATTIQGAIARLEALMGGAFAGGDGRTVERLNLLGSAYKRHAWISAADREDSLRRVSLHYKQAFDLAAERKSFDAYPLLNWLTAEVALGWQAESSPAAAQRIDRFIHLLEEARTELRKELEQERNFWRAVMIVDADLLEALGDGHLDDAAIETLAERYTGVRAYGSPREFASVLDQLDFLVAMASRRKPLARNLARLKKKLQ